MSGVLRRWPLPVLLGWGTAFGVFALLRQLHFAPALAFVAGTLAGASFVPMVRSGWRRLLVAAGFPLALAATGLALLPAWAWLLPLALLALLYPGRAWRDAPLFPTPPGALTGLSLAAPLADGALVLDGGCGLGDGLLALRRQYPKVRLEGVEWSWPLRWLCALRCRFAAVRRADLWASDWSGCAMVYLFQRPESMPRAMDKALRELEPGSWLVSLEFEVKGLVPKRILQGRDGRPLWMYQAPLRRRA